MTTAGLVLVDSGLEPVVAAAAAAVVVAAVSVSAEAVVAEADAALDVATGSLAPVVVG